MVAAVTIITPSAAAQPLGQHDLVTISARFRAHRSGRLKTFMCDMVTQPIPRVPLFHGSSWGRSTDPSDARPLRKDLVVMRLAWSPFSVVPSVAILPLPRAVDLCHISTNLHSVPNPSFAPPLIEQA